MTQKTTVLFLIDSLAAGGAERQLCELVKHMDRTRFDVHVAVFYGPGYFNGGELWPDIANLPDVTLHDLKKRRGVPGYFTALPKLLALILRIRADVLHGYIDGNLPLLLLGRLLRRPIVWGIRSTDKDQSKLPRRSRFMSTFLLRLARFVDLVIFNSESGRLSHVAMGMKPPRMLVVPNGFDITRFTPDAVKGQAQRAAWGVPEDAPLIGVVGRLNPVKDHPTFLRAMARLAKEWPEARFVCVGGGPEAYLASLKELAQSLGLQDRLIWAGVSQSMPSAYNALSVLVLSSADEGFPNALGEAMACGIPCVATRVGDAEILIGDTGLTTEVGDDSAIAAAVSTLLREPPEARAHRTAAARTRICSTFSVESLARTTENALRSLLPDQAPQI